MVLELSQQCLPSFSLVQTERGEEQEQMKYPHTLQPIPYKYGNKLDYAVFSYYEQGFYSIVKCSCWLAGELENKAKAD